MADSWLRGLQAHLEVNLERGSSQLPPSSPSPLYFPRRPGKDCFNRFTASSGSRCYCCDYDLSQGSHSLCEPVMITDSLRKGQSPTYGLNLLRDLKKQQCGFYFVFPIHTALKAVCLKEFRKVPNLVYPTPPPYLSHFIDCATILPK